MLKTRLIPCLLLRDGALVRSEGFSIHQVIGYPVNEVRRFNEWNVDELIYLDISRGDAPFDSGRADHQVGTLASTLDVLDEIARGCLVPLTVGGGIRSIDDMCERFRRGADKVTINTAAFTNPGLITDASRQFGAQAVVVSIDCQRNHDDPVAYEVVVDGGRAPTGRDPVSWAVEAEERGAGEILLNSIDRDGTGEGYDTALVRSVCDAVSVPVIALGGVGTYEDFALGVTEGHASAVAAANIFHFKELSDRNAKRAMVRGGLAARV